MSGAPSSGIQYWHRRLHLYIVQYSTVQYSTVQYSTVQYSTVVHYIKYSSTVLSPQVASVRCTVLQYRSVLQYRTLLQYGTLLQYSILVKYSTLVEYSTIVEYWHLRFHLYIVHSTLYTVQCYRTPLRYGYPEVVVLPAVQVRQEVREGQERCSVHRCTVK